MVNTRSHRGTLDDESPRLSTSAVWDVRGRTRNGIIPRVPAISAFYGIIIRMFFNEHVPPHFHAEYAEFKAEIEIETLRVMRGGLPRRAQALVLNGRPCIATS